MTIHHKLLGYEKIGDGRISRLLGWISERLWRYDLIRPNTIILSDGHGEQDATLNFMGALVQLHAQGATQIQVTYIFSWPFGTDVAVTHTYTKPSA